MEHPPYIHTLHVMEYLAGPLESRWGGLCPSSPYILLFFLSLLVNIWSRTPDIMSCHQHHNFWLLLIRVGLIKTKCVPASKFDIFILDPHCFIITEVALGSVYNTWRCFCSHIIFIIYLEFFIQTADRLCQTTGYIDSKRKKNTMPSMKCSGESRSCQTATSWRVLILLLGGHDLKRPTDLVKLRSLWTTWQYHVPGIASSFRNQTEAW